MSRIVSLNALFALVLASAATAAVPTYDVQVVATYEATTTLRGASDAGHFVGDQVVLGVSRPFVATVADGITLLPLPAGYLSGAALDVNNDGVVVGTVADNGFAFDLGEPALWTPDGSGGYDVEVLVTPATVSALGQQMPTNGGQAVAINDAGTIVGWTRIQGFQGGPSTSFSRTEAPIDLGALGFAATVRDLNEHDVIVGGGFRMDLRSGVVTPLGVPAPIGTVGFTSVIAFSVNDMNEAVVAADLASVVTENYLTYLHSDDVGFVRLDDDQLPSRFVGFYDNNDRGDVSASGGVLFRDENALLPGFDGLLDPAFADWDVDLGFLDEQRRVYTTARNFVTDESAIVLLTPQEIVTDAVMPRPEWALSVAPNPFNPRTEILFQGLRDGVDGSVDVYDSRGRLVRHLHQGPIENGRFTWDGRADDGRSVSSGVYHVVARVGAVRESVKVTLVE